MEKVFASISSILVAIKILPRWWRFLLSKWWRRIFCNSYNLGGGGWLQRESQDLGQVRLHCRYFKAHQVSKKYLEPQIFSRGRKCLIREHWRQSSATNIALYRLLYQAADCRHKGEGHWQIKASLQGGSGQGLLQLKISPTLKLENNSLFSLFLPTLIFIQS